MKKLAFLRRRNRRIRNVVVLGSSMILTVFLISILVLSDEITALELAFFGVLYVLLIVPIMLNPFGNILEKHGNGKLVTYYQVGPFHFDRSTHERAGTAYVEEDQKKNFWVTIDLPQGKKLGLEKYPTRQMAEDRLEDFRAG